MATSKNNSVWVRGRALERRKRSLLLACLSKQDREAKLILPRSQLRGERECRGDPQQREFCVPQWWADAASVAHDAAEPALY